MLSPPVLSHAFLAFPETLAFVVTCVVVWLLCLDESELTATRVLIVSAAVGALPWLHRKYSFFVFGLALVLALRHHAWLRRQSKTVVIGAAAAIVLPQLMLHLWTIAMWGTVGGPQMLDWVPFSVSGLAAGALGMFFDRERGLFAYAPIYLIVPACIALTWRQSRALLIPIGLLVLPLAAFVTWTGGFSPAARFLVPVTALLTLPAVQALEVRTVRRAAIPFVAFQAIVTSMAWWHPRDLWPKELGTNQLLDKLPVIGGSYERLLPSIATGDSTMGGWLALAGVVVLTTATVWIAQREEARPLTQARS
jgi:hypothetical protein